MIDSMARGKRRLTTQGALWGAQRVELGMSLRELQAATGIFRGFLSRMEAGVMIPSNDEFARVMAALRAREAANGVPPAGVTS